MSGKPYIVLHDFTGESEGELTLKKGEKITLLQVDAGGWCQARKEDGTTGWYPETFACSEEEYLEKKRKKTLRKAHDHEQKTEQPVKSQQPATVGGQKTAEQTPKQGTAVKRPLPKPKPLPKPLPAQKQEPKKEEPKKKEDDDGVVVEECVYEEDDAPEEKKETPKPEKTSTNPFFDDIPSDGLQAEITSPSFEEDNEPTTEPEKEKTSLKSTNPFDFDEPPPQKSSNPFDSDEPPPPPKQTEVPPPQPQKSSNPFDSDDSEPAPAPKQEEIPPPPQKSTNPFDSDDVETPQPSKPSPKPRPKSTNPFDGPDDSDKSTPSPKPKSLTPTNPFDSDDTPSNSDETGASKPQGVFAGKKPLPAQTVKRPLPQSTGNATQKPNSATKPLVSAVRNMTQQKSSSWVSSVPHSTSPKPQRPSKPGAAHPVVKKTKPAKLAEVVSDQQKQWKEGEQTGISFQFVSIDDKNGLWKEMCGTVVPRPPQKQTGSGPETSDTEYFAPTSQNTIVRDYLDQLEALLLRMHSLEKGTRFSAPGGISATVSTRISSLKKPEIIARVLTIKRVMVMLANDPSQLSSVLERLPRICASFAGSSATQQAGKHEHLFAKDKEKRPDGKERERILAGIISEGDSVDLVCPDDVCDPESFLQQDNCALAYALSIELAVIERAASYPESRNCLLDTTVPLIEGIFGFLSAEYSPSVRSLAAECMGVFSDVKLTAVTSLFLKKLETCKSQEQFRDFCVYQDAVGHFRMNFERSDSAREISMFFDSIANACGRLAHGSNRHAFCTSVAMLLDRCFIPGERTKGLPPDSLVSALRKPWNIIIDTLIKWAKVDKIHIHALFLIIRFFLADPVLAKSRGNDFLTLVRDDFKDIKTYPVYVRFMFTFLKHVFGTGPVPEDLLGTFTQFCSTLSGFLLLTNMDMKKECPFPDEKLSRTILETLVVMHKKGASICRITSFQDLLGNSGKYHIQYYNLYFQALNRIYKENPDFFNESDYHQMHILLKPYFDSVAGTTNSSKAVLLCYPYFVDPGTYAVTIKKALSLVKSSYADDSESLSYITTAVMNYMDVDRDSCLRDCVGYILGEIMAVTDLVFEPVSKLLNILCQTLNLWQEKSSKEMDKITITEDFWTPIRIELEGLFLVLVMFNEPEIWSKTLFLGDILSKPAFVALEGDKKIPHIIEYFRGIEPSAQPWISNIISFVRTGRDDKYFSGVIERTWPKLQKLCTERISHWKTILRFLLVGAKVCSPACQEAKFIQQVTSKFFSSSDESAMIFLDSLKDMDVSCFDIIVNAIESERANNDSGLEAAQKKRSKVTITPFYETDQAITLLARILDSINAEKYASLTQLRHSYSRAVEYWITNSMSLASHHPAFKVHVASLFKYFFEFEGAATSDEKSAFRDTSFNRHAFDAVLSLLNSQDDTSRSSTYEISVLESIEAIIRNGTFDAAYVSGPAIKSILRCAQLGPHVSESIVSALSSILLLCPDLVDSFIDKALSDEVDTTKSSRSAGINSCFHLRAILKAASENITFWLEKCTTPANMACLVVILYASLPVGEERTLVTEYANVLSSGEEAKAVCPEISTNVKLSDALCNRTNADIDFSQERNLHRYSDALAAKYVLSSASFTGFINSKFHLLRGSSRNKIASLLPRWAENSSVLYGMGTEESKECLNHMVENLIQISLQLYDGGIFNDSAPIWKAAVPKEGDSNCEGVIEILVDKLVESLYSGTKEKKKNCVTSATFNLVAISRTHAASILWSKLSRYWISYPSLSKSICSSSKPESELFEKLFTFNSDYQEKDREKALCTLRASASIIVEDVYPCSEFLSSLLQNAAVFCRSLTDNKVANAISDDILVFAFHSLSPDSLHDECKWTHKTISNLLDSFSSSFPHLRESWAHECIDWALSSKDRAHALNSIHLFNIICEGQTDILKSCIPGLVACISVYAHQGRTAELTAISDVLICLPESVFTDVPDSRNLYLVSRAASSLLFSPHVSCFAIACVILQKMLSYSPQVSEIIANTMKKTCSLANPLLSPCTVFMRGVSHQLTTPGALWLAQILLSDPNSPLEPESLAYLFIAAVLVHTSRICCKTLMGSAKSAVAFAKSVNTKYVPSINYFISVFSNSDQSGVPVLQQKPIKALLHDIMETIVPYLSSPLRQSFAVDCSLVLLRCGQHRFVGPFLDIVSEIISDRRISKSDEQMLHAGELITYYLQTSTESAIAESAVNAFRYILRTIPKGTVMRFYDCTKTVSPSAIPSTSTDTSSLLFVLPSSLSPNAAAALVSHDIILAFDVNLGISPMVGDVPNTSVTPFDEVKNRKSPSSSAGKRPFDICEVHTVAGSAAEPLFFK